MSEGAYIESERDLSCDRQGSLSTDKGGLTRQDGACEATEGASASTEGACLHAAVGSAEVGDANVDGDASLALLGMPVQHPREVERPLWSSVTQSAVLQTALSCGPRHSTRVLVTDSVVKSVISCQLPPYPATAALSCHINQHAGLLGMPVQLDSWASRHPAPMPGETTPIPHAFSNQFVYLQSPMCTWKALSVRIGRLAPTQRGTTPAQHDCSVAITEVI